MDTEIKKLIEQKLVAIVRDQDAELVDYIRTAWEQVTVGHGGTLQPGNLLRDLQSASYRAVVERGKRVAAMLGETLRTVKVPYEEGLSTELANLIDPLFAEDLHLTAVLNAPDNLKRRGLPVNFDERSFDLVAGGTRAGIANASRDARVRAQLVIDEYLLSVKPETPPAETKDLKSRAWDAVALKPGAFGFSLDLKKLFGRKPQS
jgi:hypothetical protein